MVTLNEMSGLSEPETLEEQDDRPADEISFSVTISLTSGNEDCKIKSSSFIWSDEMIDIKSSSSLSFPISKKLLESFQGKFFYANPSTSLYLYIIPLFFLFRLIHSFTLQITKSIFAS